jgi:hypothetical protein
MKSTFSHVVPKRNPFLQHQNQNILIMPAKFSNLLLLMNLDFNFVECADLLVLDILDENLLESCCSSQRYMARFVGSLAQVYILGDGLGVTNSIFGNLLNWIY